MPIDRTRVPSGWSPRFRTTANARDVNGHEKGVLDRGQQKSIQTDRVILVPGPADEIEIVRWIYRAFVDERIAESKLAQMLNERGVATDLGRAWTQSTVHQVLTNEKYIGNNVYNRISFKLKKKRIVNPPEMWIRGNAAFESIIAPDLFLRGPRGHTGTESSVYRRRTLRPTPPATPASRPFVGGSDR